MKKVIKYLVIAVLLVDLVLIGQYLISGEFGDAWLQCSIVLWWGIVLSAGWLDED